MAGTYYKYAERNADSQVNWAEVGKGLSDILAETNRVREEKKDALDAAQRETMNYLTQTPNGEHVGARASILDLSDQLSNRMRIADQLLKSGQMSPKDYMIFRQNVMDNTNLAFNANKAYQENYKDVMDGVRDKKYSQITADNYSEVEGFGDWKNIGWEISPDGIIMAGKMTEQEIDGKKVRTLDKTAGGVRSMDYLNQAILAKVGFYDYESKVNNWVDKLGKEKQTIITFGKIQKQGKIISRDDITSRKDIDPKTKQIMFEFIDAENAKIDEIAGDELDSARLLVDSAIIAPNNKQYMTTSDEKLAKTGENYILKKVDPNTGGFKFELTEAQKKDAKDFVRTQMRAKYNYEEEGQVVGQTQDQSAQWKAERGDKQKKEKEFAKNLAQNLVYSMTSSQEKAGPATKYLASVTGLMFNKLSNGYEVTTKTGKQFYEFAPNGKIADPLGFAKSLIGAVKSNLPEEYGNVSEDDILKYVQTFLPKGAKINLTTSAQGYEPKPKTQTAVEQFSSYIDSAIPASFNKDATGDQIVATLNDRLEGTGFKAKKSILGYVYIEGKKGVESPAFKVEDINGGLGRLSKWMKENLPSKTIGGIEDKEAAAQELIESGVIGSGVQQRISDY